MSTRDNNWLFVGEGGSVAVIDANDQGSYEYDNPGATRIPVSSRGITASALLIDPEASIDGASQGDNDILYIAGGRSGLWAMQADLDPSSTNHATRIDDSGNLNLSTQLSRRWCNNLGVMKLDVGGTDTWYLIALFSRVDKNRLRVYKLQDVRDQLELAEGADAETGYEILPIHNILLSGNSDAFVEGSPGAPADFLGAYAFGYGLAVDNPDTTAATVYVALGSAGLVRMRFLPQHFGQAPTPPPVQDGPAFGRGTHYEGLSFFDSDYKTYDHYQVYNGSPSERVWAEPPFFVDVAVQNWSNNHFLYATVDHAGWLRFDLTTTWGPSTTIDHHEGFREEANTMTPNVQLISCDPHDSCVDPCEPSTYIRNYAREIELVHNSNFTDTSGNPVDETIILLGVEARSIRLSFDFHTEGYVMGWTGLPLGPYSQPGTYFGKYPYTIAYRESELLDNHPLPQLDGCDDLSPSFVLRAGGCVLYAPPIQSGANAITAFGGEGFPDPPLDDDTGPPDVGELGLLVTFRLDLDFATEYHGERELPTRARRKGDRPGMGNFESGISALCSEIILAGLNDSGVAEAGLIHFDANGELDEQYNSPDAMGQDKDGYFTVSSNPEAQWVDSTSRNVTWHVGFIPQEDHPLGASDLEISEFDLGSAVDETFGTCTHDFSTQPPSVIRRVYVVKLKDEFNDEGRGPHAGGSVSREFNSYAVANGEDEIFIATRTDAAQGAAVYDMRTMESEIDGLPAQIDFLDPNEDDFLWFRQLRPHPEFDNLIGLPGYDGYPVEIAKNASSRPTSLSTFAPVFFNRMDGGASQDEDRWILAVPAGSLCFDETDQTLIDWVNATDPPGDDISQFAPSSPFGSEYYSHALVALFDLDLNRLYSPGSFPRMPRAYLIGPRTDGNAFNIDVEKVGDRFYCFTTDFAGHVFVYDVTDVAFSDEDQNPGGVPPAYTPSNAAFVEEWSAKKSVSDPDGPHNVWDVLVDPMPDDTAYVYISVLRRGVEVLHFDPSQPQGQRLQEETLIQTNWRPYGLAIRVDEATGERSLLVTDHHSALRFFEKP